MIVKLSNSYNKLFTFPSKPNSVMYDCPRTPSFCLISMVSATYWQLRVSACVAHLVSRDVSPFLSFIRRVARPLGIPATRGLTDHPQHSHLPPTTCKTPRFTRQYRTPGTSMLYSYIAPQRGGDRERGEERWKEERRDEEGWEDLLVFWIRNSRRRNWRRDISYFIVVETYDRGSSARHGT